MNKAELIGSIAAKSGLSKAQAGAALEAFVTTVEDGLASGERISLVGFGTWTVNERAARMGRNPRSGEAIEIAAKKVIKFKPGATLANKVNS